MPLRENWTREEVEVIVREYFAMLVAEQSGVPYNKSSTRLRVLSQLKHRSQGSVEYKNRNISAVLARMGQPYVKGYLPAYNYQRALLEDVVLAYLHANPGVEQAFRNFANAIPTSGPVAFESMETPLPQRDMIMEEPDLAFENPVKINYLALEQANRELGRVGEQIAFDYERWRLMKLGHELLADKVEWVSQTQGDGLGFDILSRNVNGTDRYIEVKTTKLSKETPFYFSVREYDFSKRHHDNFYLYRVFNVQTKPKLFIASGAYDSYCHIRPTQFKGSF